MTIRTTFRAGILACAAFLGTAGGARSQPLSECHDYQAGHYYTLRYERADFEHEAFGRMIVGSGGSDYAYYCFRVWLPAGQIGVFSLTPVSGDANFDLFVSTGWERGTTNRADYAPGGAILLSLANPSSREHGFVGPSASGRWLYAAARNTAGAADVSRPRLGTAELRFRTVNPGIHLRDAVVEASVQALAERLLLGLYEGATGQEADRQTRAAIAVGVDGAMSRWQGKDLASTSASALYTALMAYYGREFGYGSFAFNLAASVTWRVVSDIYRVPGAAR